MGIEHPLVALGLVIGFLAIFYFALSRDVRGKSVARLVAPASFAAGGAAFFVPTFVGYPQMWFGVIASISRAYSLWWKMEYCRTCGYSGSFLEPMASRDGKCKECGTPIAKPPNKSLERSRHE
jgi:hypothetical protein